MTSHKWGELVSSGRLVCRCHDVFLWCYVCFVLLRFRVYAFVEAAALRSIVLRYTHAPIATRVSFFLSFLLLFGDVAFSEYFLYHRRFLFVWRVRRTFLPSGWCFSILSPRAGFLTSAYVRIQSIKNIPNADRGIFIFPVQLTTSRIGNLTRLIHTLAIYVTIHTYIISCS